MPRLSASSLKSFEKCPGQFEFDKLKDVQGIDEESKYTIVGSIMHEALQSVLEDTEDVEELGENELAHLFKSHFHAHEDKDRLGQDMINRAMKGLQVAARYLGGKEGYQVRDVEEKFETEIDDVPFLGYIDLTTRYEVIDWKTGNMPDGDDRMDEVLQGLVYWEGFKELYGEPPEAVKFVYLKESQERVYSDNDEMHEVIRKTREIKNAVQTNNFPYQPGDHCYFCSYTLPCPESQVGVGGIRWELW